MKNFFLIVSFFLLLSCGFEPIFSSNKTNFSIIDIDFAGEKDINLKIENNLKIYSKSTNKSIFYKLIINSNKNKNISSKNSQGDPLTFLIKISVELNVMENNSLKGKTTFSETFNYKNISNKFDLNLYEKNIEKSLVNKINERIILYLYNL